MCANLWLPGLGFWLARQPARARRWFAAFAGLLVVNVTCLCVPSLFPALVVLVPCSVLLTLALIARSFHRGGAEPRAPHRIASPAARWGLGLALLALSVRAPAALPIALLARNHFAEAFAVPTQGMAPTIRAGDRFILHKRVKWKRWDVVAFRPPPEPSQKYVKRLVGLPGEQVELVGGEVHINGRPIARPPGVGPFESNPRSGPRNGCEGKPIRLAADECFVLGDNSPRSADSRYWDAAAPGHQPGAIPVQDILGVATWIYWPPAHWRSLAPAEQR